MKITIVSGSHRDPSQSFKVASYIKDELNSEDTDAEILSLANNPLPLWDQTLWEDSPEWNERLAPWIETLQKSDAFVFIVPEWHGQVPSGLKNFFLIFGKNEFAHKPALIVSISSADGGAYPVAELRMSSYKNNRICYIPEQLIIRNVESVLNEKESDNNKSAHDYFSGRVSWTLDILKEYAIALQSVRSSSANDFSNYGNGM